MNNEIKEILFLLHNDRLTDRGKRKLEDYITNLQQEINNMSMNEYSHGIDESWYRELYEDYKSRIDKAVEYIKENAWYMNKDDEEILDRIGIEGLLKILEGDK